VGSRPRRAKSGNLLLYLNHYVLLPGFFLFLLLSPLPLTFRYRTVGVFWACLSHHRLLRFTGSELLSRWWWPPKVVVELMVVDN
jgi:hypothetical protein